MAVVWLERVITREECRFNHDLQTVQCAKATLPPCSLPVDMHSRLKDIADRALDDALPYFALQLGLEFTRVFVGFQPNFDELLCSTQ